MKKIIFLLLIIPSIVYSQDTVKIATYNLLNYDEDIDRNNYFKLIIDEIKPDILVVQEIKNQIAVNNFLDNVLNYNSANYQAGTFILNTNINNAIYYNSVKFSFISNTPIPTISRDLNRFRLLHLASNDTIDLIGLHLKSSQGSTNQYTRETQIDSLRKITNSLSNPYFIVLGDFNIYSTNEQAYQKMFDPTISTGKLNDMYTFSGTMNNSSFSYAHTQSTRTRNFEGGASGGLDDRFDMILFSDSLIDSSSIYLLPNSYIPYGNDGQHYNDSINQIPNLSVNQIIADALHYASDHLPVVCKVVFKNASYLSSIQGSIDYYNSNTTINSATIYLYNNGNIIDSVESTNGIFLLNNIPFGEYEISIKVNEAWGGVNSTDALLMQHEYLGIINFDLFEKKIADVNNSQSVNSTDALTTRMRFTNIINSFDLEDWLIENNIIEVNSPNQYLNIKVNCNGDVNHSY